MVDSDGKTHLDKPYCALQKECFGGIVGAKSPYADGLGLMGGWSFNRCCAAAFRTFSPVLLSCERFQSLLFRSLLIVFLAALFKRLHREAYLARCLQRPAENVRNAADALSILPA